MNNVFQFFMNVPAKQTIWQSLKSAIQPGTIIITSPSLHDQLKDADLEPVSAAACCELEMQPQLTNFLRLNLDFLNGWIFSR
jgi:uridine phosphorylase